MLMSMAGPVRRLAQIAHAPAATKATTAANVRIREPRWCAPGRARRAPLLARSGVMLLGVFSVVANIIRPSLSLDPRVPLEPSPALTLGQDPHRVLGVTGTLLTELRAPLAEHGRALRISWSGIGRASLPSVLNTERSRCASSAAAESA
jgi:hypothetical protein